MAGPVPPGFPAMPPMPVPSFLDVGFTPTPGAPWMPSAAPAPPPAEDVFTKWTPDQEAKRKAMVDCIVALDIARGAALNALKGALADSALECAETIEDVIANAAELRRALKPFDLSGEE